MSNYINLDHLKFVLSEVHNIDQVLDLPRYTDYDRESIEMMLDSIKDYSDKELYPYFAEMDRHGATYSEGSITAHPQLEQIIKYAGENGFIGAHFDYEEGGAQMPFMASLAAAFIMTAANNSATGYASLTSGAASLIRSFGSKDLFDRFVPQMISGKWGGTMALTEPQAGSSLSDIKTTATENEDGTYSISGQKIFISAGDHQCVENIVHLTLARIEGAPLGTKGISLFAIPKKRVENGELVSNDVYTAGEFDKMGQKAYVTTHLVFGEKDNCTGWLVGEANKGLKYMFQMMNGARIEVGLTAAAIASAAYQFSLQYAKERPQGRKLDGSGGKNMNAPQTLIINHPDVRRMLMLQKAIVEGSTSLLILCARYHDMSQQSDNENDRERNHGLLEILTPVAKTYPSEMGSISVSNGMQVLGGYGFTTDFPLEQLYRDIRITAIYEGTTGIQSLDLLGRKLLMKNGEVLKNLLSEIMSTIEMATTFEDLKPYANMLSERLSSFKEVFGHLVQFAMQGKYERFLSDATIFMEYFSIHILSWQWLTMATAARQALVTGEMRQSKHFYEGQINTMKFYFKYELAKTSGLKEVLLSEEVLTIAKKDEAVEEFA